MKDAMEMMGDAAILLSGHVNDRVGKLSVAYRDRERMGDALQEAKSVLYALSGLLDAMDLANQANPSGGGK